MITSRESGWLCETGNEKPTWIVIVRNRDKWSGTFRATVACVTLNYCDEIRRVFVV